MSNSVNTPISIEESAFWSALEFKSPQRFTTNSAYEYFQHPDAVEGNKYKFFVQLKKPTTEFFEVIADKLISTEDLINICKK